MCVGGYGGLGASDCSRIAFLVKRWIACRETQWNTDPETHGRGITQNEFSDGFNKLILEKSYKITGSEHLILAPNLK